MNPFNKVRCGVVLLIAALGAPVAAQPPAVLTAQAKLPGTVARGKSVTLEVKLSIKHPYHVNANPASERFLIPTSVGLTMGQGIT
ncbi:MAG: hypothetical protein M3347_19115, partial [Armatimonadota bacterium]|nr:hypothetical protein [Armatimonadota bacterium]